MAGIPTSLDWALHQHQGFQTRPASSGSESNQKGVDQWMSLKSVLLLKTVLYLSCFVLWKLFRKLIFLDRVKKQKKISMVRNSESDPFLLFLRKMKRNGLFCFKEVICATFVHNTIYLMQPALPPSHLTFSEYVHFPRCPHPSRCSVLKPCCCPWPIFSLSCHRTKQSIRKLWILLSKCI